MSYKSRTLFRLTEEINRSLFLPHIQRPFVWEEDQMRRLFDSLMRNYPIQTFLFWRTKDEIKARKFMADVLWDADLSDYYDNGISKAGMEKTFVLDGQQRLQTLYALFCGAILGDSGERLEAYFDLTTGHELDEDGFLYTLKFTSVSPGVQWYRLADLLGRDAQRNAEEIADAANEQLDGAVTDSVPAKEREKRVRRNIAQLVSLLREEKYFWVQELDGVANAFPYKVVLEIFVRVNSGGTKLDASDLMFAAMKEGWDEIEEAIEETTELLNGTNLEFDKTFPLKCLLVANGRGAETTPEKFTGADGGELLKAISDTWSRAEQAFLELRDFLAKDLKVYADKVVRSYTSFIPLFDFLYHNPQPNEISRSFMKAYHYKSQLFGWYSQSTDTTVNTLHSVVGQPKLPAFPIIDVKAHFRRRGNIVELERDHLKLSRLRFILLNLIYVDQMGASPFDVKYKGNEPHIDHIYPRYLLGNKLGLATAEINQLGNYRFIGATDNIRKRAEAPSSYFARLRDSKVDIGKHLLVQPESAAPETLLSTVEAYIGFRDRRLERIWAIANSVVNPEVSNGS